MTEDAGPAGAMLMVLVLVGALVLAVLIGLLYLARRRARAERLSAGPSSAAGAPGPELGPATGLAPEDIDEMRAKFATALTEHLATQATVLVHTIEALRGRNTPLRAVEPAPHAPDAARLLFADGRVLIAKAVAAGDLSVLAYRAQHGSLVITASDSAPEGLLVEFSGLGDSDNTATAIVIGLDQGD